MSDCLDRECRGDVSEICRLALPLLGASLVEAFCHLANRYFLSQAGDTALGAVLPAGMLAGVLTTFLSGVVGYSSTFVAQAHGTGRSEAAAKSFAQALWIVLATLPLFVLAALFGDAVFDAAGHALPLRAAEKAYFRLSQLAGVGTLLTAACAAFFTGLGRTRLVGLCLGAGPLVNVLLDWLLIRGCGSIPALGIQGAGLAAVVAQLVPGLLLVGFAVRDPLLIQARKRGALTFDQALVRRLLRFGVPLGIGNLTCTATFAAFSLALGRLGGLPLGTANVVFAILNVGFVALTAIGNAVAIVAGRSWGRQDRQALSRCFCSGVLCSGVVGALFFCVVLSLWPAFGAFFVPAGFQGSASVFVDLGTLLLWLALLKFPSECAIMLFGGLLRGVGDTRYMTVSRLLSELFVWMPLTAGLSVCHADIVWFWLSMPVNLTIVAVAYGLRWKSGRWMRNDLFG